MNVDIQPPLDRKAEFEARIAQIRKQDKNTFLDWTDPKVRNELLTYQGFHLTEKRANPAIGAGVVVGVWGDHYSQDTQLQQAIEDHLQLLEREYPDSGLRPNGEDLVGRTGFIESYWTRFVPKKALLPLQVAIGAQSVVASLEHIGLTPADIDKVKSFKVPATAPASILLAQYIAEVTGMSADTKIELISGACHSFAKAIQKHIDDFEGDPEGLSLTVGIESMMAMRFPMSEQWPGTANRPALAFFSDGATAFIGKLGRFKNLFAVEYEQRDAEGALAGINTVNMDIVRALSTQISELVWESPIATVVELPQPHGEAMSMDARATTEFFLKFLRGWTNKIKETGGTGLEALLQIVTHALGHRPSQKLRERYAQLLEKMGLPSGLLAWNGSYGNGPCIIWGHEMAEKIQQLKPGDKVAQLFFGAGATGGFRIDEIT